MYNVRDIKKMKYLLAVLMTLMLSVGHAEIETYVGNSNISGSNAGALAAWKAEFAGTKIRRETFESTKLIDLRTPDGCYSSSCLPPAVDGFTKGGLIWSSPGKAMRLITGGVSQGKYAMRVIDSQRADYTVSVKSLSQLAYGICLDLDTNGGNNDVRISLDGREVASFKLHAYGLKFDYPVHRFCVIDTAGFRTVSVARQDIDVFDGYQDEWHPSLFSTDNVFFVRTSAVPAFSELTGYPIPVIPDPGTGECAADEVLEGYEDDGSPKCEGI